jgi:hypothetical protein
MASLSKAPPSPLSDVVSARPMKLEHVSASGYDGNGLGKLPDHLPTNSRLVFGWDTAHNIPSCLSPISTPVRCAAA